MHPVGHHKSRGTRLRQRLQRDAWSLRRALAGGEFVVHYQPKLAVRTRAVVGVEALVRLRHQRRGLMAPADFLPAVEASPRLLSSMTKRVLDSVLADCARWLGEGRRLPVSVNVSVAEFLTLPLADTVREALRRHRVEPSLLTVEVKESAIGEHGREMAGPLDELRDVGVAISIDDFQNRFASPARRRSLLQSMPLDELKIDRAVIGGVAAGDQDRAIARHLVDVGSSLGVVVVAKGVEDERTLGAVTALGCPVAQGFLFAPSLPADALLRWLEGRVVVGPYGPRIRRRPPPVRRGGTSAAGSPDGDGGPPG